MRFQNKGVKRKTRGGRRRKEEEEEGGVENQRRVKNSTNYRRSWGEKRSSRGSNQQLSFPIRRDQTLARFLYLPECWRNSLFFTFHACEMCIYIYKIKSKNLSKSPKDGRRYSLVLQH